MFLRCSVTVFVSVSGCWSAWTFMFLSGSWLLWVFGTSVTITEAWNDVRSIISTSSMPQMPLLKSKPPYKLLSSSSSSSSPSPELPSSLSEGCSAFPSLSSKAFADSPVLSSTALPLESATAWEFSYGRLLSASHSRDQLRRKKRF